MKLEINYKKKTEINTNKWRVNSVLLNNQWVNIEIEEDTKLKSTKKRLINLTT